MIANYCFERVSGDCHCDSPSSPARRRNRENPPPLARVLLDLNIKPADLAGPTLGSYEAKWVWAVAFGSRSAA
jgi:hypothetical protein